MGPQNNQNLDPMASTPANPMPPPPVPEQSTINENDNPPEAKRSRLNDISNPLELTDNINMPPPPVPEDNSIHLNSKNLENTHLEPENPMSIAPMSVNPIENENNEPKSLEETFSHISFKDLDDDKKRDGCMMKLIEADMGRENTEDAGFFDISNGQDRKRAARQFYSLLVLRKQKIIEVEQSGTCEDIRIFKGEQWGNSEGLLTK